MKPAHLNSGQVFEYARPRGQLKPARLVLDLLHSHRRRGSSVGHLMEAGKLFGFTDNTLRVTLSRLVSRGLLVSPRRGYYQLSEATHTINRFVDDWRLGEERVKPWTPGQWLVCHWSKTESRDQAGGSVSQLRHTRVREKGRWALESLGWREVRTGLWARPDNLALEFEELERRLRGLGLPDEALLMGPCHITSQADWQADWRADSQTDPETGAGWRDHFQVTHLEQEYARALARLQHSAQRLDRYPVEQAMVESFILGGDVINLLAKDPLLPQQWLKSHLRETLWQAMLKYDAQGKAIWADAGGHADDESH